MSAIDVTAANAMKVDGSLAFSFATQEPSDPAAGANLTITVPSGKKWLIKSFSFILATSAAVANRVAGFDVASATRNIFNVFAASGSAAPYNQPASTTIQYSFGSGCRNDFGPIQSNLTTPIPEFPLGPGFTISTFVENLQAGDQISEIVLSYIEYSA